MKIKMAVVFIVVLLCVLRLSHADAAGLGMHKEPNKRIAVLDFFANNIEEAYAVAVRNKIEVALFKMKLSVIERRHINKILFEKGIDLHCKDAKCAAEQGKLISADFVVVGDIIYAGEYIVTVRIVSVADGRITFADTAVTDQKEEILEASEKLAKNFSIAMSEQVSAKSEQASKAPERKVAGKTRADFRLYAGYVVPFAFLGDLSKAGYRASVAGGANINNWFVGLKTGFFHLFARNSGSYPYQHKRRYVHLQKPSG